MHSKCYEIFRWTDSKDLHDYFRNNSVSETLFHADIYNVHKNILMWKIIFKSVEISTAVTYGIAYIEGYNIIR